MTTPDPDTVTEETCAQGDVHETIRVALAQLRDNRSRERGGDENGRNRDPR